MPARCCRELVFWFNRITRAHLSVRAFFLQNGPTLRISLSPRKNRNPRELIWLKRLLQLQLFRNPSATYSKSRAQKTPPPFPEAAFFVFYIERGNYLVLGRPGSDLLSQGLSHSTIGAEEFNGRVRDGIGFKLLAKTTRPAKDKENEASRERSTLA